MLNFISYKGTVYKVNKARLYRLYSNYDPMVSPLYIYIEVEEFGNKRNNFLGSALFADNATEEQTITRVLFANTLESEDFYA